MKAVILAQENAHPQNFAFTALPRGRLTPSYKQVDAEESTVLKPYTEVVCLESQNFALESDLDSYPDSHSLVANVALCLFLTLLSSVSQSIKWIIMLFVIVMSTRSCMCCVCVCTVCLYHIHSTCVCVYV